MRNPEGFSPASRIAALLATVFICAAFCPQATAADAATTFRLSNQFPPNHHISVGLRLFADKVKEYSNNGMEVQIYESASLYRDADIVKAIRSGGVETGLVPVNKWSGLEPAVDIFDMPFVFRDLKSMEKFLREATPSFDQTFSKYGAKLLFWVDYGWTQFWNSKRPLKSPADFKGLTMRSYAPADSETLKALGAAPTLISSSEMYMALQRGTIDGATTGMPAAVSRKVIEVTRYLTISNYASAQFMVQANAKWFDALQPEQKEAIMKASRDAEQYIRSVIQQAEDEAEAATRKAGIEVHVITPEERKVFYEATEGVRKDFMEKTGEWGKSLIEMAARASS